MLNNDQDRLKKLMDASISAFETLLKYKNRLVPSEFSDEAEKVLGDSIYRFKKVKENLLKSDFSSEALEQNGLNAPQLTIKLKAIEFYNKRLEKSFVKEDSLKLIQAVKIPLVSFARVHRDVDFVEGILDLLLLLNQESKDPKSAKK
jgi:hypothetical protein